MSIVTCPNCKMKVLPRSDGTCPSCQKIIVQPDGLPTRQEETQPTKKSTAPSYGPGLRFIIAGGVIELLGRLAINAIEDSAHGIGAIRYVAMMNTLTPIMGTIDVVMTVLVILGIYLLMRAFIARKKALNS